jgi:hypothetical protein
MTVMLPRFFSLPPFVQQQCGRRCEGKGNKGEGDGMVHPGAGAVFALGKRADKLDDAAEEQEREGQDCAQLNNDGVHLPVGVVQRDLHQPLGDAQVGRRTNGEKLGQAFNDAQ